MYENDGTLNIQPVRAGLVLACPLCASYATDRKENFRKHVVRFHKLVNPCTCPMCGDSPRHIHSHLLEAHSPNDLGEFTAVHVESADHAAASNNIIQFGSGADGISYDSRNNT